MTETFGILNFGHCDLFVIWDLLFTIFENPVIPAFRYYNWGEARSYLHFRHQSFRPGACLFGNNL